MAREAGGPLRHDPLMVRPIKDTTHLDWSIIMVMYQVFKYYVHHILLVQKFL
jgi:hypothetical protein